MAAKQILVLDLGEKGGQLEFEQPNEVRQWLDDEITAWSWIKQIHEAHGAPDQFAKIRQVTQRYIDNWSQSQSDVNAEKDAIQALKSYLESTIPEQGLWLSTSPTGAFLLRLKNERHALVAAGAYLALGGTYSPHSQQNQHPLFYEGIIEGFLYKREIDWTATEHRHAFEKLKQQYAKSINEQKKGYREIEVRNDSLNDQFHLVLQDNERLFRELHQHQETEFRNLIQVHEANLKAIEEAYDQKLALLMPVKYWSIRRKSHASRSKSYATATVIVGAIVLAVLAGLSYKLFLDLPENSKPQVWQVGVFTLAAFFGIWLVRILVRLFISNMHLATDAEERVTMLQTYLSIIREGSEFAPEDKKLILERLFHPAADGLVKDDGAPPTPLEILTRR